MRVVLLVLAACLTPCASAAADPRPPHTLPEDVVRTWEEAGAQFVWIGPSKYRFLWFEERRDDLGARVVPGFWFKSWNPGLLAKVAPPNKPFGVVLELSGTTGEGLKELARFPNLTTLYLVLTDATDARLKELTALKGLTTLYLEVKLTELTDASVKVLAEIPSLSTVHLDPYRVTDDGLKKLSALKNLTTLDLRGTKITGTGLKALAGLKNLATLSLSYTDVTGAGLTELTALKSLTTLNLSNTKLTESSRPTALKSRGPRRLGTTLQTLTSWAASASVRWRPNLWPSGYSCRGRGRAWC